MFSSKRPYSKMASSGAIQIIANTLVTAASTVIIARGGKGGDGTLTNGGGGGAHTQSF